MFKRIALLKLFALTYYIEYITIRVRENAVIIFLKRRLVT